MPNSYKDLAMSLARGLDLECQLNRREIKDSAEAMPEEFDGTELIYQEDGDEHRHPDDPTR